MFYWKFRDEQIKQTNTELNYNNCSVFHEFEKIKLQTLTTHIIAYSNNIKIMPKRCGFEPSILITNAY